jgi:hypothetical protein
MATTAQLNASNLLFKSAGTEQCRLTPAANTMRFSGATSADPVFLDNVRPGTGPSHAVTKSQLDAGAVAHAAARTSMNAALTTAFTAADTALGTSIAGVSSSLATEVSDRAAGDAAAIQVSTAYTDAETAARVTAVAGVQASADANTALISAEGADRIAQDAATLATAKAHADAGTAAEATARASEDGKTLADAATFTTTSVAASEARSTAYTNTKVDALASGVSWKASVRALATASTPLAPGANGALTVDGVACAAGDRVLLNGQSDAKQNGIYTVTAAGSASAPYAMARASDADTDAKMASAAVFVTEGTYAESAYILTTDAAVLGTSDIAWTIFASPGQYSGGDGISIDASKVVSVSAGGIVTAMLTDDCITEAKMGDASVGAAAIQAGACGNGAIGAGAVTDAKCDFTDMQAATATFSGDVQALSYLATSDERRKQDIEDLDPAECEAMVNHFRTCKYRFKSEPDRPRTGTIAQSLQKEGGPLADLVHTDAQGDMSVSYIDFIAPLTCALRSALARIEALEKA